VTTKVHNLYSLFDPKVKLLDGGRLMYIIYPAFTFLQYFLNNKFFLEIVDLLYNLFPFMIHQWLTVHKQKRRSHCL